MVTVMEHAVTICIVLDKVFGGTALHEVWKSGVLDRSRTPVVNYRYMYK